MHAQLACLLDADTFEWALLWGIISHLAMDVPKHFDLEDILALAARYIKKCKLKSQDERSTDFWSHLMRLEIPHFDYKHPCHIVSSPNIVPLAPSCPK